MTDFNLLSPDVAVPVARAAKHVARHATNQPAVHAVTQGVSMLTIFIVSSISSAVSAGLAWYIRGRGMTGVQIDLNNIKNDISNLKGRIGGSPAPVVVPPAV